MVSLICSNYEKMGLIRSTRHMPCLIHSTCLKSCPIYSTCCSCCLKENYFKELLWTLEARNQGFIHLMHLDLKVSSYVLKIPQELKFNYYINEKKASSGKPCLQLAIASGKLSCHSYSGAETQFLVS